MALLPILKGIAYSTAKFLVQPALMTGHPSVSPALAMPSWSVANVFKILPAIQTLAVRIADRHWVTTGLDLAACLAQPV